MTIKKFPENINPDDLLVGWTKNIPSMILTGLFSLFLLGAIIMLIKNPYESSNHLLNYKFILTILVIAEIYCSSAFIWQFKNYKNPYKRLVANKEGLFLDITLKPNYAFFISWKNISGLEKNYIEVGDKDDENFFSGDVLCIKIKQDSEYSFPKGVYRGIVTYSEKEINMAENTFNLDLDTVIDKLNTIKKQ